jgi:predicted nucleotidyltransferase
MNRDIQKKLKDNSAKIKEKFRVKEIGIFGLVSKVKKRE